MIKAAHSMSLDGFIDGPREPGLEGPAGRAAAQLFAWLNAGDVQSRKAPQFKLSAASAKFFDEGVDGTGAVIVGRHTYDVSGGWGGFGPFGPEVPLIVVTHELPANVPVGRARTPGGPTPAPYAFVTQGVERAVERARAIAGDKHIVVMGASMVQQCLDAGLLDELIINLVPVMLGRGVRLFDSLAPGRVELQLVRAIDARLVTHLQYSVVHSVPAD